MRPSGAVPRFGLLVPCKNGARFLPRLFAAARAQTRPFDEIWLFDDGSTDNTGEVARSLGAQVLRAERSLGPSAARNRLVAACACEWLHFHDADDTMDPTYLARTTQETGPNVDVVVCDMAWIEDAATVSGETWTYRYDRVAFERHPIAYLIGNTIGGINGLYRRSCLKAVGGFNEALFYWEDMDLNMRLCAAGARVAIVNECLVTAYRHPASHCNTNVGEVWRVKLRLLAELLPSTDVALRSAIAQNAEEIARCLAGLGFWGDVSEALRVARDAGGHPPTTKNPALQLAKALLSPERAFRLQHWIHHLLQGHAGVSSRGTRP